MFLILHKNFGNLAIMESMNLFNIIFLVFGVTFHTIGPSNVEGILTSSEKTKNHTQPIQSDVLLVSVNATEEDLLQISSKIRLVLTIYT